MRKVKNSKKYNKNIELVIIKYDFGNFENNLKSQEFTFSTYTNPIVTTGLTDEEQEEYLEATKKIKNLILKAFDFQVNKLHDLGKEADKNE